MQDLPVHQIMTTDLITINLNDPVSKVSEIFNSNTIHHIPIIDEEGCLEGIISKTDFERIKSGFSLFRNPQKEEFDRSLFRTLRVCEMMTKDVVRLQPSDNIGKAYKHFQDNKFRALPIVEKGKLVGLVTPLDLLDYFFAEKASTTL